MRLGFMHGTRYIEFDVAFRKRKTIQISITPPNEIKVSVPRGMSEENIIDIVKIKANWIEKKILYFKDIKYEKINRKFINNEPFMYLGRSYLLQIEVDKNIKDPQVKLFQGKIYVYTSIKDKRIIQGAMEKWYREKTKEKVEERVKYYLHLFKKEPRSIRIKQQKRIWASCTYRDDLLFNWRCVMARPDVLDYIIVHEMCHMHHKNHSKDYWNMVESIIPDYRDKKEWLKIHGYKMIL
ncbi:hypothetical protein DUF45 [Gottschalkia acidurici 9a]|uniref:YgjP-like metallopeptidase domain-containing protein n=1 Tax=Gottschalkia acidurici (strain ATCC 7906 / DSM 604 / BCRC 14475 / CIP 104303 / KCTC 5404 / NCIMB 10678 / 9a) TaxID=1128398 RepID=K0AZ10_GOTA9|nr:SprT family zinc-dependent metalloprotease [Gottschalkia acidurici]AFS78027.1 hypothetical protein DUF45 [Gottschalkia acidurici 9a]